VAPALNHLVRRALALDRGIAKRRTVALGGQSGKDSGPLPSNADHMRASVLSILLLAACAGAPEIRRESAAEVADHDRVQEQEDRKRRDFRATLVRLDQAMDSYVQMLSQRGEFTADSQTERLYKLINDMVLDRGAVRANQPRPEPGTTFAQLTAAATDASKPDNQAIALAALGFSARHDAMPTILQGTQLADPFLVDRAVLGLAVLQAPATKTGSLEALVTKQTHPDDGRVQAAWAIYRIQLVNEDQQPFTAIWRRFLTRHRETLPAGVLVTAVRGLGHARDAADGDLVATFLTNPTPRVRMAAAIAIGRINAQQHWEKVLDLIGPREPVQNVRLCAAKALVELAGGIDHKYDVAAWRKTFDRGAR
jgi:hypothetical protein